MSDYKHIPVSKCRPYLKKILSKGGAAFITIGEEERLLQHLPMVDRPRGWLPWPLSIIQHFSFRIFLCKKVKGKVIGGIEFPALGGSNEPKQTIEFNDFQVEEGIDRFLLGASPDDEVSITYRTNPFL